MTIANDQKLTEVSLAIYQAEKTLDAAIVAWEKVRDAELSISEDQSFDIDIRSTASRGFLQAKDVIDKLSKIKDA